MKVISAISTKGGVGKSTLAFALGIEAAKTGSVYFIDADPQASLSRLCERRDKLADIDTSNPVLVENAGHVQEALAQIRRAKIERDFLFIDAPGSMMGIIEAVARASDCLILPMLPSILDLDASRDAIEAAEKAGKGGRVLIVLNRIDGRVGASDAVTAIEKRFGKKPLHMHQRVAYARAHIIGRTGAEIDKACGAEIAAIWAEVQKVLGEANG